MMRRSPIRSPIRRPICSPICTLCAAALAAVLVAGCGFAPRIPGVTPYRIDIQQGNYISQEMVAQLKPGMTKEQVRFILGTPMVTDIFHSDRWDYVYWRETPRGARERRSVTVLFEQGQLARVDGDVVPSAGQPSAGQPSGGQTR